MLILANEMVCVGVFVLFGCGGFLVLVMGMFFRTLGMMWNMLFGREDAPQIMMTVRCVNADCGELNRANTRFCRRCGSQLRSTAPTRRRNFC
jgi:hypothetical protein